MTKMHSFMDAAGRGVWANVRMDNVDPCFISVAQSGVLVKKSRLGFFGAKLYQEDNLSRVVETSMALDTMFPNRRTPPGMNSPVLRAFTNAALHCRNLGELAAVLNGALENFQDLSRAEKDAAAQATSDREGQPTPPEKMVSKADTDRIFAMNRRQWEAQVTQFEVPPSWTLRTIPNDLGTGVMAFDTQNETAVGTHPMFAEGDAPPHVLQITNIFRRGTIGELTEDFRTRLEKSAQDDLGPGYHVSVAVMAEDAAGHSTDVVEFSIYQEG